MGAVARLRVSQWESMGEKTLPHGQGGREDEEELGVVIVPSKTWFRELNSARRLHLLKVASCIGQVQHPMLSLTKVHI